MDYSIVLPTCRRPDNIEDHIPYLENLIPPPNKIAVVHPQNDFTSDFDFSVVEESSVAELFFYKEDPGLFECKYTSAFEHIDDDWIFTVDDDVFPGRRYPEVVEQSYKSYPGIYGGIGFVYKKNHFNGFVCGGTYTMPEYQKVNKTLQVDAPGQSFFWKKSDVGGYLDNSDLPDWSCKYCSDDIYLAWVAWKRKKTNCYVTPHKPTKKQGSAIWEMREGDVETQSLVGGSHPDREHKNRFVQWIQKKGYTVLKDRETYNWRDYVESYNHV